MTAHVLHSWKTRTPPFVIHCIWKDSNTHLSTDKTSVYSICYPYTTYTTCTCNTVCVHICHKCSCDDVQNTCDNLIFKTYIIYKYKIIQIWSMSLKWVLTMETHNSVQYWCAYRVTESKERVWPLLKCENYFRIAIIIMTHYSARDTGNAIKFVINYQNINLSSNNAFLLRYKSNILNFWK